MQFLLYLCRRINKNYIIMKKIYSFCVMLALVLSAVSFVACDKEKENNPSQTPALEQGMWVCQVNANGYMYFEFEKNTFKYHEVGSMWGTTVDAWVGGTHAIVENDLYLTFTDSNVPELMKTLDKYETHAVLDNDVIHYDGHDFILQK